MKCKPWSSTMCIMSIICFKIPDTFTVYSKFFFSISCFFNTKKHLCHYQMHVMNKWNAHGKGPNDSFIIWVLIFSYFYLFYELNIVSINLNLISADMRTYYWAASSISTWYRTTSVILQNTHGHFFALIWAHMSSYKGKKWGSEKWK